MKNLNLSTKLSGIIILLFLLLSSCGSETKTEDKANETKSLPEINADIETPGGECGEDLKVYLENLETLIAIAVEKSKNGDSENLKDQRKTIGLKLQELGKKMQANKEQFMDPECSQAWTNAQMKYSQYVQDNLDDFMPKSK